MSDAPDAPDERTVETADMSATAGRVEVAAYDAGALAEVFPPWTEMADHWKLAVLGLLDPTSTQHVHNTVCIGLHEFCVDAMDYSKAVGTRTLYVAVGDDNNTAPAYEDRTLNNEGYRTRVANPQDGGAEIQYTTLLGALEANDIGKIRELGVVCVVEGSGGTASEEYLFNHALIDPESKSSEVALTFKNELGFNPA